MAYCGAEVIRVESRKRPDVVRLYVPPWAPEMGTQPRLSPWFTDWNVGKRFVALELTKPEAVELGKRLVAACDVVATGIPLGLTGTPGRSGRSGARVGEDNDYVFGEVLGMTREEIQRYIDVGAIEPPEN